MVLSRVARLARIGGDESARPPLERERFHHLLARFTATRELFVQGSRRGNRYETSDYNESGKAPAAAFAPENGNERGYEDNCE
jgi:hypothetical protein